MSKEIFSSEQHQKTFHNEGFFVLPEFLKKEQINEIQQIFNELHTAPTTGFYSSSFSGNDDYLTEINHRVLDLLKNDLNQILHDYKILGASFLVKNPGQQGKMPVHQDWTIVDERKTFSMTIWVPIQDVDEFNGAIRVLPRSHRISNALRSPTLPGEFSHIHDVILDEMVTLEMKKGDAFIFDHSILHASHLNSSDRARIAVCVGIVPKTTDLLYYHHDQDLTEKFEMPDDFFLRYKNIGDRPSFGKSLGYVSARTNQISKSEFHHRMQNLNSSHNLDSHSILEDYLLQEKLDKEGFIVSDLLNSKETNELLDFYNSLKIGPESDYGFHVSLDRDESELKVKVNEKLRSILVPAADTILKNFRVFTSSFVIKEPGLQNIVPPHQDWTFVDESTHESYTLWVALVDTDLDNGALGVIPGSHLFFDYQRASPSPQAKSPLTDYYFTIFPYVKVCEMKAGQMLLFNNNLIHASPPNTTGTPRVAAGIGIAHESAQLRHVFKSPHSEEFIEYAVDEDFFMNYNNKNLGELYDRGEEPQGIEEIRRFSRKLPELTDDKFKKIIESFPGNSINKELIEKLAGLYDYNEDGTKLDSTSRSDYTPTEESDKSDDRNFFQIYTPKNIMAEIKYRLTGK